MSRPSLRRRPAIAAVRLVPAAVSALALAVAATLVAGAGAPVTTDRVELAATGSAHSFLQVTSTAQLRQGVARGAAVSAGSVRLTRPVTTRTWAGKRWVGGTWTGSWTTPRHAFSELVPSWEATTPRGTAVRVSARVASSTRTSGWKVLGTWAQGDHGVRRSSAGSQGDAVASVATDTVRATSGTALRRYQLRVDLMRQAGTRGTPTLRSVQAVASRLGTVGATSRPLLGPKVLAVPRLSQMVHRGRYPQYGGGGQAWCSPTSLAMVLGYHGALPGPRAYSWVERRYSDRVVPHLARMVYDHGYRGAGNWAFNTAFAANRAEGAFVTRLSSLRDAERFIAAGVPLVASVSFGSGQLRGAPISSTQGHLVVIAGFDRAGDVVVNDPAAPSNASVRRTYDRGQFERAWQTRSKGLVYVVQGADHPLPQGRRAG